MGKRGPKPDKERRKKVVEAYNRIGSIRGAAAELGIHYSTIHRILRLEGFGLKTGYLAQEATKRGLTKVQLTSKIMRMIERDRLVDAIIDDEDDENRTIQ